MQPASLPMPPHSPAWRPAPGGRGPVRQLRHRRIRRAIRYGLERGDAVGKSSGAARRHDHRAAAGRCSGLRLNAVGG